jgi:hypothetical protein
MNLKLDDDVRAVADFMVANIPAGRLVSVANCVSTIAPAIWGHHKSEPVVTIRLVEPRQPATGD